MNTRVKPELAKLIKEKGFDIPVRYNYDLTGELHNIGVYNHNEHPLKISAPIIADVIMWIYKKHGIWISDDVINNLFKYKILQIEGIVSKTFGNEIRCSSFDYNSPTEAYSAGIEYTLKNLIE